MLINQFNGGLSTRVSPHLIQPNQAIVYKNIDSSQGALAPLRGFSDEGITVKEYAHYVLDEKKWISSSILTEYLNYQDRVYLTNRVDRPQKYYKGVYNFLGIERPLSKLNLAKVYSRDDWVEDKNYAIGDTATFGGTWFISIEYNTSSQSNKPDATNLNHQTWRVITDKVYVRGEWARGNIYKAGQTVEYRGDFFLCIIDNTGTLNNRPNSNDELNDTWRLLDNTSSFHGVYQYVYTYYNKDEGIESAPSPLSDQLNTPLGSVEITNILPSTDPQVTHIRLYRVGANIATFTLVTEIPKESNSYNDTILDSDVDGRLLNSENFYEAPKGLKFLTTAYSMLFGALGTSLRFTPIAIPDAWPPEYEIKLEESITGIGEAANGVLVFTSKKTYLISGTGPLTLTQQLLRGDVGCKSFESIQQVYGGSIIWAGEDGLYMSNGGQVVNLTKDRLGDIDLLATTSLVHKEIYYCEKSINNYLMYDFRFEPIVSEIISTAKRLYEFNGSLYGWRDNKIYEFYKFFSNPNEQTFLNFFYTSPLFSEGSLTNLKTYKKIYVRFQGSLKFTVFIDNKEVKVYTLDSTSLSTVQLNVPQNSQRGYTIQFSISGKGFLYEIDYTVEGRKNDNPVIS